VPDAREAFSLLQVLPADTFRFLTSEEAPSYSAITYCLYWNRVFLQNEVSHDDLRDQASDILRTIGIELDESRFQRLLDQLCNWHVIDRQYSAPSIKSVREWRRRPYYYWLTEDGFRLYQLLQHGQGLREARPFGSVGKDFVRSLEVRLQQLLSDLHNLQGRPPDDSKEDYSVRLRKAYRDLRYLHQTDFQQFRDFLTKLNSYLVEFGRDPGVDFQKLQRVRDWLQSYVEDMLIFFREASDRLVEIAGVLERDGLALLAEGHQLEREDAYGNPFDPPTPVSHPPPLDLLRPIIHFFERRGALDDQTDRIRDSTSATIRKLEEHYRRLAESSYVTQLLNMRMQEMRSLDLSRISRRERLARWLNDLMLPSLVPFAPRIGTFQKQGDPPRPRRKYEYLRREHTDCVAQEPSGSAEPVLGPDLNLVEQVNSFVEERILRGADRSPLEQVHISDLKEFRTLLEAVKNDPLYLDAPVSRYFSFIVQDPRGNPETPIKLLHWVGRDGRYLGPNLIFCRKPRSPAPELRP